MCPLQGEAEPVVLQRADRGGPEAACIVALGAPACREPAGVRVHMARDTFTLGRTEGHAGLAERRRPRQRRQSCPTFAMARRAGDLGVAVRQG